MRTLPAADSHTSGKRLVLLDLLRGIGIIFVMWYHLIYDLEDFYGICGFIHADWMDVFRDCMVMMLVLISGVCCRFSKNNRKRGLLCLAAAACLSLVTYWINPSAYIRFGILHMFGMSMLLYGLFQPLFKRDRPYLAPLFFCAFLLFFPLSRGALGIYRAQLIPVPRALYRTSFLFWLGLPGEGFVSTDYYPLLPWTLLFFCGAMLGDTVKRLPDWAYRERCKPLALIGRHTMLLYLLHQPVYYAVFWLLERLGIGG